MYNEKIVDLESRKSFEFFWNEGNFRKNSSGFGLVRDRTNHYSDISSIASVGFALTAIPIAVERGWITKRQGYERTIGTLSTLLKNAQQVNGFYYHFLNMKTAERAWNSEVSIIDTGIAICGGMVAGEYFGGEIKKKAEQIYARVNWEWYRDPARNLFYMGYSPEKGFSGWWDFYAEQLILYILAAAAPVFPVNSEMFYQFQRSYGRWGNSMSFIHSWFGSLFTHQFSHAWFDFRNKVDGEGIDWWTNSVLATKANRQFCMDHAFQYKTLGANSWGITPCDGPGGYNGRYGTGPSGMNNTEHFIDGTIAPAGAAGSIVFTPQESIAALNFYYENFPTLWGKYGFLDAYNIDISPEWFATDAVGINKGITLLMLENYRTGFVWEYFMRNQYIQKGMKKVGLAAVKTEPNIA